MSYCSMTKLCDSMREVIFCIMNHKNVLYWATFASSIVDELDKRVMRSMAWFGTVSINSTCVSVSSYSFIVLFI